MLWLNRPPWARWLAAASLIGLAIWFETRPHEAPLPADPAVAAEPAAAAPPGWWSFPVDLSSGTDTGDRVLVLIVDTGEAVEGEVTRGPDDDPFGSGRGLVAVPPERAAEAAAAAATGGVVILVATD